MVIQGSNKTLFYVGVQLSSLGSIDIYFNTYCAWRVCFPGRTVAVSVFFDQLEVHKLSEVLLNKRNEGVVHFTFSNQHAQIHETNKSSDQSGFCGVGVTVNKAHQFLSYL